MTFVCESQPLCLDMSPIPSIPDGHGTPVACPGDLESDEAVLFVETHAITVNGNLLSI